MTEEDDKESTSLKDARPQYQKPQIIELVEADTALGLCHYGSAPGGSGCAPGGSATGGSCRNGSAPAF